MLKLGKKNRHFDVVTTQEGESFRGFFAFRWIKLKFGVIGNSGLLISNLNSKMQYQFKILRKCHFFELES